MAFTLDIVDENEKLLIALSDVQPDEKLSALRERLIGEAAFPRDYQFLVSGIALKPKQEKKYTVDGACGASVQLQVRICVSNRRAPSPKQTPSTSYSDPQLARFNIASDEPTAKKAKKQEEEKSKERRSDALNHYSESDISEAKGVLEKEQMRFFNKKLDSLRSNQDFDSWGQEELRGVVEVSWTLEKTNLLKLTVKEQIAAMPSSEKTSDKEKKLLKNLEEVEMCDFAVKEEYKNFCVSLKEKGESHRSQLEKKFDDVFTKLKKAQAHLQKCLEHNANPLEAKYEAAVTDDIGYSMNVDLNDEERESLADKVKEEDEVMCDSSDDL